MNTHRSGAEVDLYRRNGFLVVSDFLTRSELECWRDAVHESVDEHIRLEAPNNQKEDGYYKHVFIQCVNIWKTNEKIKQIATDPRLGKLATDLAGTSGVHLYHDHALIKEPWANPTNFHIDNPYDPYDSRQAIMLWVALDDATMQNGCMYLLPGTHLRSHFKFTGVLEREGVGGLFDEYPDWMGLEPYVAEMKAGDAVFLSGMIAHAAGPNMTPRPRRAYAMLFMPQGATYNGRRSGLPYELVEKLKVGDVIPHHEELPLLFSYGSDNLT